MQLEKKQTSAFQAVTSPYKSQSGEIKGKERLKGKFNDE